MSIVGQKCYGRGASTAILPLHVKSEETQCIYKGRVSDRRDGAAGAKQTLEVLKFLPALYAMVD